MAVSAGPKIAIDGLVLCLDAGNSESYPGSGTVWTDLSGNGLNGALTNGPTFNTGSLGSISFDGVNDYIGIPYNSILAPTTQITVEVFASASWSTITESNSIVSKTQVGGWNIALNETPNNVDALFRIGGAYRYISHPRANLLVGFNYIGATYDGQNAKLFINGVLVDTYTHPTPAPISYANNNSLMIAADPGTGASPQGYYFPGAVSNVKIYNRALSQEEITQNFNALRGRYGI